MEYGLRRTGSVERDYSSASSSYGFNGNGSYVGRGVERSVSDWETNPFDVFAEKKKVVKEKGKDKGKVRKMRVLPKERRDKEKNIPSGSPMRAP